jgi:fucose 4-O-acetylase-like acetyltransferase
MNTTDRDAYWDNVKFALICLIVIGHFSNSIKGHSAFCSVLSFFIYTFHVAGFVLIAGMFHNNRNVKGKTLGYLVLYLLIKIANQIPYLIVDHSFHNFDLLRDKSTPWFVFAMSAFICITYLCRNFDPVKVLCVSVAVACATGYLDGADNTLYVLRITAFYPFYFAGTMLDRGRLKECLKKRYCIPVSCAVLAGWWMVSAGGRMKYMSPMFSGTGTYSERMLIPGALCRLAAYCISTILLLAFLSLIPQMRIPGVTKWGSRTLQVYFWHKAVLTLLCLLDVNKFLRGFGMPGKLLWLLLGLAVTVILSFRPFEFPAKTVLDLCKKSSSGHLS